MNPPQDKVMHFTDLVDKHISVIVDGLNKPCGGVVIDVSETLITLKPDGNNNVLVIPISRIASIMYRGINDDRTSMLQDESLESRDEKSQ